MKTVGSILRRARQEKGWELNDVFAELKIQPRFLKALEEGEWGIFDSAVHAKGFLKNYAEYLGLNTGEVLAFFRREYKEEPQRARRLKSFVTPLNRPRWVITPGMVISAVTFTLVALFLSYLFFQYRSFAGAPILIIDQPDADTTTNEPLLNAVGRTDPDSQVYINGQKINVDEKGSFSTHITLVPGANILNFEAVNKLGRKNTETRTVILQVGKEEAPKDTETQPTPKSQLEVRIEIGPNSSWLRVVADDKQVFEGVVVAGGSKAFVAGKKLHLRTGNAGSTKVWVNGKEQASLGPEGQVAEREYTL
jgi:transcriptional regulator with XRE-family HTH domain